MEGIHDNQEYKGDFSPVNYDSKKHPARIRATALDKLMYQVDTFHDGQCRCVFRFDGFAEVTKMARTVELSLRVTPVLDYRFVYNPWQFYWEKCSVSTGIVPFRFVDTLDPDKEITGILAEPMNPKQGPQVSVSLIRCGYDSLCVKLSHMVADAMGLLDYICILGNIYNQLLIDPGYIPPETTMGNRGQGQILKRVGIPALIKGIFLWNYPKSQWGFPKVSSNISGRAFSVRIISQKRVTNLKAHCNKKGVKFTEFLIAAFYQALIDVLIPPSGARLPIELTIDLRQYLPSGKADTICDLAGAYFPVIRHTKGQGFEQTLQKVVSAVSRAKTGQPWLGSALFLELITIFPTFIQTWYAQKVMRQELTTETSHPFFSNLGSVDHTIFDFGDLKAVDLGLFGPVSFPPNFLITVYSFQGKLYLTSSFCPTAADPQMVNRFFDCFVEHLPE
jgi:NRPS condensation-like uncharacterized protein